MYVNKLAGKERKKERQTVADVRVHSPADYMEWLVRRSVIEYGYEIHVRTIPLRFFFSFFFCDPRVDIALFCTGAGTRATTACTALGLSPRSR